MGRRNKVKYKYNPEQEDASERLMNEQSERERRIAILYLLYSVIKKLLRHKIFQFIRNQKQNDGSNPCHEYEEHKKLVQVGNLIACKRSNLSIFRIQGAKYAC